MLKNEVLIYLDIRKRRIQLFAFIVTLLLSSAEIKAFAFVNLPNEPNTVTLQVPVRGTVRDRNGNPIAGATVKIKDQENTITTDEQGRFQLQVPSNNRILTISHVGFASQEVPLAGRDEVAIILEEDASELDEVVVIGYGTVKKRDLTGSVASVKSEEIMLTPTHNPLDALKGRVPGMDITRTSGQASSGVDISLRGNRSISGSNTPLYIIDGFQGGNIADLNQNDIESIEVLKDASATAIYGSQGANGVIIVTTKQGAEGKTKVSYNGFYGINGLTDFPAVRTGDDYVRLRREAGRTTGIWSSPEDDPTIFSEAGEWNALQDNQWVDWTDLVMKNGSQNSHNINVTGGNEKTQVFISGGYFREEGMMRNDNLTRYTGRFNIAHEVSKWMKVGMLGQVAYYNRNNRNSPLSRAISMSPFGLPYDENGNINIFPVAANPASISPLADERGDDIAINNQIRTNTMLQGFVELTPLEGLSFRSNFGANLDNYRTGIYDDRNSLAKQGNNRSEASVEQSYSRFYNWDNIVTYNKSFNDHQFTVTALTSYIRRDTDLLGAVGYDQLLSSQLFYNLAATDTDSRLIFSNLERTNQLSFAGRIDYNYKSKYLLTISNRYDGASRLAPGNKWASFPSIAGAWTFSEEAFLKDSPAVDLAKIRLSYGVAGNSGIDAYGTQGVLLAQTNLNFGGVPASYYEYSARIGNPLLGWETTRTVNLGLDLAFFKNRLSATIDLYQQNTHDILFLRNLPPSSGVQEMYENIGTMRNRGLEVLINAENIKKSNFTWNSTLSFTTNKEEITGLIDGDDIITNETDSRLLGRPLNSFYSYRKLGIWQSHEADEAAQLTFGGTPFQPGDIKVADINGDGIIDPENDRVYLGSTVPKFVLGLQNNFRYKAFDLGIYAFVRWGQMINAEVLGRFNPSGEGNGPAFADYWTPENPSNDYPRPRRGANISSYAGYQSLNFVDGSFIKLQNVSFGYTLPVSITERWKMSNLRIYMIGNNLWTYAKYPLLREYDPETGGSENFPLNRQIVFGISANF